MKRNLTIVILFFFFSLMFLMCSGLFETFNTATGKSPERNIQKIGIPAEFVTFEYLVPDGMIEDPNEKEAMIQAKLEHLNTLNGTFWGEVEFDEETLEFAFESTWDEINNKFIGFKNLDVDWDAVYDEYIEKIKNVQNYGEYAHIITLLAYLLEDAHVYLQVGRLSNEIINSKGERIKLEKPNALLNGAPVFFPEPFTRINVCPIVTEDNEIVILNPVKGEKNPYKFEVGDEIVGFNGIPWSEWLPRIEKSNIPIFGCTASNPKAIEYYLMKSAAANATLFEKMNVKRVKTGEIETMDIIDVENAYICFEITDVEGLKPVDKPEGRDVSGRNALINNKTLTYGVIKDLNIGYIYLFECPAGFDEFDFAAGEEWNPYEIKFAKEFEEAILSLMDTDGIIIDLRYNIGGRSEPLYIGLSHLIKGSEEKVIYESVERDVESDDRTVLIPSEDDDFPFKPDEPDLYYENPVIVLSGPDCVSACDYTIGFMSKFPDTFTIIGKSNNGSFSGLFSERFYTTDILDEDYKIIDYITRNMPITTSTFVDEPDTVLRTENFIDIPVWFTKEDIINGIDTVREYAIKLIKEQNQ